jgi:hypothetical protein
MSMLSCHKPVSFLSFLSSHFTISYSFLALERHEQVRCYQCCAVCACKCLGRTTRTDLVICPLLLSSLPSSKEDSAPFYLSPPLSWLCKYPHLIFSSVLLLLAVLADSNMSTMRPPAISVPTATGTNTTTDIIQGPRKCHPTEHITENGDPLARKKAKAMPGTSEEIPNITSCPQHVPPRAHSGAINVMFSAASRSKFRGHISNVTSRPQHALQGFGASPTHFSSNVLVKVPGPQSTHFSQHAKFWGQLSEEDSNVTRMQSTMDNIKVNTISDDDDKESDDEPEAEGDIAELSMLGVHSYSIARYTETSIDRLSKSWDAPVYVFFKPMPSVQYINNRKAHVFECTASPCRYKTKFVRHFLYTGDASSTSNLRRHAKLCWGKEALAAADETRDVKTACEVLRKHKGLNGSITAAFKRAGTGKETYSHRQHTKLEARYVSTFFQRVVIASNL